MHLLLGLSLASVFAYGNMVCFLLWIILDSFAEKK